MKAHIVIFSFNHKEQNSRKNAKEIRECLHRIQDVLVEKPGETKVTAKTSRRTLSRDS